jgi:outer membrane protein TolC
LSAAYAEEVAARSELEVAHHELARLLARPSETVYAAVIGAVRVRQEVDTARAALLASAERTNPELRRLRLQRDAARAEREAARGSWWPRIQTAGRYIEYAGLETRPQGEWQAGAQLSYALFTGGARAAAVDRAGAELRAANAELAQGQRRIADAVDRARSALAAADARVSALTTAEAQSQEVTRIERLALDAGAGVQLDYLTAEANLFRVRAALTDARAQEVWARVELARVSGELTLDWVEANLENVP